MKKHSIIIVGGGASGCIAALLLKEAGSDVAIMEAQDRILKKILVTGNGRCNITNAKLIGIKDASPYYSSQDKTFAFDPLITFEASRAIQLFEQLGLPLTILEEGKMYPKSLQASSVSDLIRLRLKELDVPVYLNSKVKTIVHKQAAFLLMTSHDSYTADQVIIAGGGQAMPSTGSDGSLYSIVRELGHHIIKPLPALVQLKTDFSQLRALSGVKIQAELSLWDKNLLVATESGELLFTDYGISGPPVLQLSRFASQIIADGREPQILLNLFPDMEESKVVELIQQQRKLFPAREAQDLLNGIVHKKLIPILFKQSGLDKMTRTAADIPDEVFEHVCRMLTKWPMRVTETTGFVNSQSTLGGVDLRQIHHKTLESKLIPKLYFSGEILDVCGACGGYNLQWAWSSAFAIASDIIAVAKNQQAATVN